MYGTGFCALSAESKVRNTVPRSNKLFRMMASPLRESPTVWVRRENLELQESLSRRGMAHATNLRQDRRKLYAPFLRTARSANRLAASAIPESPPSSHSTRRLPSTAL